MSVDAVIYVVDDDDNVRHLLATMLRASDYRVKEFGFGADFLSTYDGRGLGCILMDIVMPDVNGLDVLDELTRLPWSHPVIMITGQADVPMATRALESGAFAFIEKPFRRDELIQRIDVAIEHDVRKRQALEYSLELVKRFQPLTPREREILDLVVQGRLTKQIACQLGISQRTVETHRSNIMAKVGADSLAQLVAMTVEVRLVESQSRSRSGINSEKRPWRFTSTVSASTNSRDPS